MIVETPLPLPEIIDYDPDRDKDTVTGKPRATPRRPGRPKSTTSTGTTTPPPRKRPGRPAAARATTPDYRSTVLGLVQLVAFPLAYVAPADSFALTHHAPPIADALHNLAVERPEVAAALDRLMAVGPYGALIGACVPLMVQLAHNHGLVTESQAVTLGAVPKRQIDELLSSAGAEHARQG